MSLKAEFKVSEPGAESEVGTEGNLGDTITAGEKIIGYEFAQIRWRTWRVKEVDLGC